MSDEVEPIQEVISPEPMQDDSLLGRVLAELIAVREELALLRQERAPSKVTKAPKPISKGCKSTILEQIKELASPQAMQKRYKTISPEQIAKEKKPERKEALQRALDYLNQRKLINAAYRPQDGWKFCHDNGCVELLYRIDQRSSAVYNTRHRPISPKSIKELANKGEKYCLPYGLEKIDYSFKTIFITEGIFDSCFLKNCLAYSNWILPNEMSKVIDIFREEGFTIVHILDNFRLGDKGGLKGLETIVSSKDWLAKGDRLFSWDVYSDCDDLNEIAIKCDVDEIDPQTILDHTWGEEEARVNCAALIGNESTISDEPSVVEVMPRSKANELICESSREMSLEDDRGCARDVILSDALIHSILQAFPASA